MKRATELVIIAVLLTLCFAALRGDAVSSTVRGRLDRVVSNRTYPAQGLAVSLNHPRYGRSAFVYSDKDGMYYFVNIPADAFTLEVWVTSEHILRFAIKVQPQGYTDIPPIRVQ